MAINANIEAIRAADAGKSFAVVAGEVKSLADQVTKQATEIRYQINNIQESTDDSVNSVMSILGVIDPLYSQDRRKPLRKIFCKCKKVLSKRSTRQMN